MPSGAVTQGASGALSGAASGAAIGAAGGPIGAVGGAIIGGVAGIISGMSSDSQQANSEAWAEYNRQMQYQTDIYNINSSTNLAMFQVALDGMAANRNADQIMQRAIYNAGIIDLTTEYTDDLLENELARVWQDLDLDITQLEEFRARELGTIVAEQGASGTVIGEGSNADVVVGQMTAEAMDIAVLEFGADREAANIANERAQNTWSGQVAVQQTMYNGQVEATNVLANSAIKSTGTLMTATISADAGRYSALQKLEAAGNNITQAGEYYDASQTQDMVKGMFTAASTYASYKYANKVPAPKSTPYSGPLSPGYQYNNPIGTPGSSLVT